MRVYRLLRNQSDDESGQSIVLMGLMTMFILAILAIVVESGFVYINRRNLQNTADAAALAGAQSLNGTASGVVPAQTVASTYAADNLSGVTIPSPVVDGTYTKITATVNKDSDTAFASWLSFGKPNVSAHAAAMIKAALLPGPGVVPLAVNNSTYVASQGGGSITLKQLGGSGTTGNYGIISIDNSTGAKTVCDYLQGGSTVPITDPGTTTQPGNESSLHNCLVNRMTAAATNTPPCLTLDNVAPLVNGVRTLLDHCNPLIGAGRNSSGYQPTAVIVIPILTDATFPTNGNKPVDLVKGPDGVRVFGIFLIDRTTTETINGVGPTCNKTGQCNITGRFLQNYNAAVLPSGTPTGTYVPGSLTKVVQLVD